MCGSMVDVQSATAEIRRGKRMTERKKERRKKESKKETKKKRRKKAQEENIMQGGHKNSGLLIHALKYNRNSEESSLSTIVRNVTPL